MSKNIYITEGRRGRRFGSVQRLKTPLQGGGSCLWVPEDDVQTDHLFATENKVYLPENYGFSGASVHVVDANLSDLDVDDNGAYWPEFDGTGLYPPATDYNGYSKVSVNVPASKQNTFMDSVIVGTELNPNYPYSWILWLNASGASLNEQGEGYSWSTTMRYFYQSKYPPYIHTYENQYGTQTVPCAFVYGEDSLLCNVNWDNSYTEIPQKEPEQRQFYDRTYIHGCELVINDQINSSGTLGGRMLECVRVGTAESGHDELRVNSTYSSNVSIVSDGSHLAMKGMDDHMKLYKRTSSSFGSPTSPDIKTVRVPTGFRKYTGTGIYPARSGPRSDVYDYRLIQWEPFQSGAEWLAYCQAHSVSV